MGQVHTVFTSEDKDVVAALRGQQAEMAKLREENRKLSEEGKQGSKSAAAEFVAGAVRMAAGAVSVQGAIRLVNQELQHQIDLQRQAAAVQVAEAGSQIKFLRNLGIVSKEERAKALQTIGSISAETGVSQRDLFTAATSAISAKGSFGQDAALAAIRQAARVAPEDPAELAAIAGGLLDVASLTGTPDAAQNLGFLVGGQQVARLESLQSFAKNLLPAGIGLKQFGDSPVSALALPTALTLAMKDPSGSQSATAAIQLDAQLREFLPDEKNTADRIGRLQQNAELRDQFLADASFEAKAKPFIEDLLKGGETANLFTANLAAIKPPQEAGPLAEELIAGIQDIPQQRVAQAQRTIEATRDRLLSAQVDEALRGFSRDKVNEVIDATGAGFEARWMAKGPNAFGPLSGPMAAFEEIGGNTREEFQLQRLEQFAGTLAQSGDGAAAGEIRRLIDHLEKQAVEQGRVSQQMLEQLRAIRAANPSRPAVVEPREQ